MGFRVHVVDDCGKSVVSLKVVYFCFFGFDFSYYAVCIGCLEFYALTENQLSTAGFGIERQFGGVCNVQHNLL